MESGSGNKVETPAEIHLDVLVLCSGSEQCPLKNPEESCFDTCWSSRNDSSNQLSWPGTHCRHSLDYTAENWSTVAMQKSLKYNRMIPIGKQSFF